MIKKLPQSYDNRLAYVISSTITLDEETSWIEELDAVLMQFDKVSAMIIVEEDASWNLDAGIEDIKWLFKHYDKFEKLAIITDSKVWEWLITLDSKFAKLVNVKEKHFHVNEREEAWQWIAD
jgi:hypothetical protein